MEITHPQTKLSLFPSLSADQKRELRERHTFNCIGWQVSLGHLFMYLFVLFGPTHANLECIF